MAQCRRVAHTFRSLECVRYIDSEGPGHGNSVASRQTWTLDFFIQQS